MQYATPAGPPLARHATFKAELNNMNFLYIHFSPRRECFLFFIPIFFFLRQSLKEICVTVRLVRAISSRYRIKY